MPEEEREEEREGFEPSMDETAHTGFESGAFFQATSTERPLGSFHPLSGDHGRTLRICTFAGLLWPFVTGRELS